MKVIIITGKRKGHSHPPTRHNEEFGRACKTSGLIHQALRPLIQEDKDCRNYGKLTQRLMMIQQSDMTNEWGQRTVQDGQLSLLEGYDLNCRKSLFNMFPMRIATDINGMTGICRITAPSFVPQDMLRYEGDPSHVRFSIAACCFDFPSGWYSFRLQHSNYLPVRDQVSLQLMTMVDVQDKRPVFLLLGVAFYNAVNKHYHLSRTAGGLYLTIVKTGRGVIEP